MILSYIIIYVKFVYDYVTDDKVIRSHGLDIDNYLLSPRVNLQQLMEVYFKYCFRKPYEENGLLFSEKHLCNDNDFGRFKLIVVDILDDTILDPDIIQYLYGLHFVRKDSSKLKYQKKLIMEQIKRGYVVNYSSDEIKKVLK